ncbi:hypothetical protein C8J41_103388 [Sphingomonas sp. PP-CC-3G-468]|nr:hypothetical protein C8J41_103388 [Sphingomonas sp. PP-CC-3G-468]
MPTPAKSSFATPEPPARVRRRSGPTLREPSACPARSLRRPRPVACRIRLVGLRVSRLFIADTVGNWVGTDAAESDPMRSNRASEAMPERRARNDILPCSMATSLLAGYSVDGRKHPSRALDGHLPRLRRLVRCKDYGSGARRPRSYGWTVYWSAMGRNRSFAERAISSSQVQMNRFNHRIGGRRSQVQFLPKPARITVCVTFGGHLPVFSTSTTARSPERARYSRCSPARIPLMGEQASAGGEG